MNSQNPTHIVHRPYESTNPDPITLRAGELVKVGQKFVADPEWQNWVKCENADGQQGWTPVQLLRIDGEWATALDTYTAHELTLSTGAKITVTRMLNGWAWAETEEKEWGWIPARNLTRIE